jgi:hypothetical protein
MVQPTRQGAKVVVEVFQTDDHYAGPILKDRYQVLASAIGPTFYVYDHQTRDAVRTENGDTRRFEKIFMALSFLGFTIGEMKAMSLVSTQDVENAEKEMKMTKAVKVSEAAAKAMASAQARREAKAANEEQKDVKKAIKKVAHKVESKTEAPAAKGRGQAAMFRELIAAGKLDDKAMLAEVRRAFPDRKVAESSVSFYRARMGT